MGGTFKHTNREDQHIRKEDKHISLLNTQILKNAEKKKNNTQIKINKLVCLKVKNHLFSTQIVLLKHRIFLKTFSLCVFKSEKGTFKHTRLKIKIQLL